MIIKIPSKNIYGNLQNDIVRKNVIDKVECSVQKISLVNEYETVVLNEEQTPNATSSPTENTQDFEDGNVVGSRARVAAAIILTKSICHIGQLTVPKYRNNETVYSISNSADSQRSGVQIEVQAKVDQYIQKEIGYNPSLDEYLIGTVHWEPDSSQTQYGIGTSLSQKTYNIQGTNFASTAKISIEQKDDKTVTFKASNIYIGTSAGANLTKNLDISIDKPTITENSDSYTISDVEVLCGYDVALCYVMVESETTDISNINENLFQPVSLQAQTRVVVTPLKIDITVYGNLIRLEIDDETKNVGVGKNNYSFDGNELIQATNTYGDQNSVERQALQTITEYKSGKETATITCSIEDYYDTDGNLAISTKKKFVSNPIVATIEYIRGLYLLTPSLGDDILKLSSGQKVYYENSYATLLSRYGGGSYEVDVSALDINCLGKKLTYNINAPYESNMVFRIGDNVIPYIMNAQGVDTPISLKKDGTAKQFEVVGVNIKHDGAPWQELTLLEKTV